MEALDFTLIRERLYTAVISDTLDSVGLNRQAAGPSIRPLSDHSVIVGRARTGLYAEVYHHEPGENPYDLEIELVDSLGKDDVCVLCCNRSPRLAPWGELLSTAAQVRGAAGCVTDGLVRDVKAIRAMDFPVFHGGIGPLDSKGRGKVIAIDVPVELDGVSVTPGDLVVADCDGVVFVPRAVEAEVIGAALKKTSAEDETRDALRRGESLRSVFRRLGVL